MRGSHSDCRLAGAKEGEEADEAGEAEVDFSAVVAVSWEHSLVVEGQEDQRLQGQCRQHLPHLWGVLQVLQTIVRP